MAKKASDTRFSAAGYDPRFIVPSTKKNKVKVDERFSKKELQKLNVTATGKKAKVDRYGRPLSGADKNDYDKYFEEEGESGEESENSQSSGQDSAEESESDDNSSNSEDESGSDVDSDATAVSETSAVKKTGKKDRNLVKNARKSLKNAKTGQESAQAIKLVSKDDSKSEIDSESDSVIASDQGFVDRARGEGLESDSSSDSDTEVEMESDIEVEEEKPAEGKPSATFAVVNLDWDNVRAVDLMSTFSSFVPKGGNIKSVSIYPSEFGKEQMQKEEVEGPPKELFRKKKEEMESDSDSDEDLDLSNKDDLEKAARKLYTEDDGKEDYDSKALRRYQLQRLRYYYAIVICDSIATAQNIYQSCDGAEYESTANIFDLRYVPQDMDFDDEPRDTCTKIPASYRPDSTFVTDALQHSKVKLTWDETPKERMTLSSRQFSQKEIDDMDFKAYLASDSEESDAGAQKDLYKSLLGNRFGEKDTGEDDVDMEITFNPGLTEASEKDEKVAPREESTIEAYKRKEKERRQKRAEKWEQNQESGETKDNEKKTKKGKKRKDHAKDAEGNAELELLMMDDADAKEHFNMKDVVKAEKNQRRKRKGPEPQADTFTPDLADERFAEVFENHEFAIDPTNSEFKKTNTMKKILKERGERQKREDGQRKKSKGQKRSADSSLSSLVKKFKGKKSD